MKPRIRKPLRKGSLVYHGTSAEDDFMILNGPAWVSDEETVAKTFVDWGGGDGQPRIIVFRVSAAPRLAVIGDARIEWLSFRDWVEEKIGMEAEPGTLEFAGQICDNARILDLDGWHIPNNYGRPASDTMLCEPGRFLEFVEVISVER